MIGDKILRLVEQIKQEIKVKIPCKVTKNNGKTVDVELDSGLKLPSVPIFNLEGIDSGLFIPLRKGTQGALHVFDRDLSNWLLETKESLTNRRHDLSDCFFVAGYKSNKTRKTDDDKLRLYNDKMIITLDKNGKISIEGGSKEMLDIIIKFMETATDTFDNIINDIIVTPAGNGSFSPALMEAWSLPVVGNKAKLNGNKSDLQGLKI